MLFQNLKERKCKSDLYNIGTISMLDSGSRGLGTSTDQGCCVVFLGKTLKLSRCLSLPRSKWVPVNCQGTHSLTHAHYARWRVGQQRDPSTSTSELSRQSDKNAVQGSSNTPIVASFYGINWS